MLNKRVKVKYPASNQGLTLMELAVVIGLLAVLMGIIIMLNVPRFIMRARDAERKSDLEEYRISLEEYFTDKGFYPPETIMDAESDCSSTNLQPYMDRIRCDPSTNQPYLYKVSDSGQDYWLYAFLHDEFDPDAIGMDCDGGDCDTTGMYNYAISSKQVGLTGDMGEATPTPDPSGDPVPTPTPAEVPAYCGGVCDPGVCGECCPGAKTRCTEAGDGCYSDASC